MASNEIKNKLEMITVGWWSYYHGIIVVVVISWKFNRIFISSFNISVLRNCTTQLKKKKKLNQIFRNRFDVKHRWFSEMFLSEVHYPLKRCFQKFTAESIALFPEGYYWKSNNLFHRPLVYLKYKIFSSNHQ